MCRKIEPTYHSPRKHLLQIPKQKIQMKLNGIPPKQPIKPHHTVAIPQRRQNVLIIVVNFHDHQLGKMCNPHDGPEKIHPGRLMGVQSINIHPVRPEARVCGSTTQFITARGGEKRFPR